MNTLIVTGGCGFIGSNFIDLFKNKYNIICIDKMSYAALTYNENNYRVDIGDTDRITKILNIYQPFAIVNFAAETHVDRSIDGPQAFIDTNVSALNGLLMACMRYRDTTNNEIRMLHVSTDEVYGTSLGKYLPNSPYAATKAASDHIVRSYHSTYGLDTIITHSSNNFGPRQHPEKFIPTIIMNVLDGIEIPIYGDGLQQRDWIYVDDNCKAIDTVLTKGKGGSVYDIGGKNTITNLEVINKVLTAMCRIAEVDCKVTHVEDRPGHDIIYRVNPSKTENLGWKPEADFEEALYKTATWYIDNRHWINKYNRKRLGLYRN